MSFCFGGCFGGLAQPHLQAHTPPRAEAVNSREEQRQKAKPVGHARSASGVGLRNWGNEKLQMCHIAREERALLNYEYFMKLPVGMATIEQVRNSSAGIDGWANSSAGIDGWADANDEERLALECSLADLAVEEDEETELAFACVESCEAAQTHAVKTYVLDLELKVMHKHEHENMLKFSNQSGPSDSSPSPEVLRSPAVEHRTGSILDAAEDFICHQCNCCMFNRKVEGLAAAIYASHPDANAYAKRDDNPNMIDAPGTVAVCGRVVNLFAQYAPGPPSWGLQSVASSKWADQFFRGQKLLQGASDTAAERLQWFRQCLADLPGQIPQGSSVAFPSGIGCGLAGGSWEKYSAAIEEFARVNGGLRVVLYASKPA